MDRSMSPIQWPAVVALMLGLVVTGLLWRGLVRHDRQQIAEAAHRQAHTFEKELRQALDHRIDGLQRMSQRWQSRGGTPRDEWTADTAAYSRDMPDYQAIQWVDADGVVRWTTPVEGNEAAIGLNNFEEPSRRRSLMAAREHREPVITEPLNLVQGGSGFIVFVPTYVNDRSDGFIVGVFRLDDLVNNVLAHDHDDDFHVAVSANDQLIYGRHDAPWPADSPWRQAAWMTFRGTRWRVHTWPTPQYVARVRSPMPTVALVTGIGVSILLALTVHLGRHARARSIELDRRVRERTRELADTAATLHEQKQTLEWIVEAMTEGVVVVDRDGEFVVFNAAARTMLHLGATDAGPDQWSQHYGLYWADTDTLIPQEDEPLYRAMHGEHVSNAQIIIKPNDGAPPITVCSNTAPILDEHGRPAGGVVVFRDITEQREAQRRLEDSEERFRRAVVEAPLPIAIHAEDGRILYLSKAWTDITGYDHEDIPTVEAWARKVYGESGPIVRDSIKRMFDLNQRVEEGEFIVTTRHGEQRTWDFISAPLGRLPDGRRLLMSMASDVTDRKRSEQDLQHTADQLAQSNAELEQFAYIASHDLQEPLRAITGHLQLVTHDCKGRLGEEADTSIDFAVDAAERMKRLINDLLMYSRLHTQAKPFESVDLESTFEDVVDNLALAIEESGAEVTHDALPTIQADPVQMMQLLQNLTNNAIKFRGDEPPHIHIGARRDGDTWRLTVRDNGIGIDTQYAERIFHIFQRLHGAAEYRGTGIGLAVCKRIVERHGGRIWMESQVGRGATFHFTIPDRKEVASHGERPLRQAG